VNAAVLEKRGDQWRFAHDKLREGLLAGISPDRQGRLHEQIAVGIERAYAQPDNEAARLSYHWFSAGNLQKAAHYAVLAGDQAMRIGANVEAKNFFERAVNTLARLLPTTENRQQLVDTTLKLSRVAAFSPGENMPALLQQALETAQALEDEVRVAYVLSSFGAYYYMGAKVGSAFSYFNRCMALSEKLGLEELLVLPYNLIGRALISTGEYPQAAAMLSKGIELAEKFKDQELLAGSLAFYAATLWHQGNREEGTVHGQRAMVLAEEIGYPSRIAGNLMAIGYYHAFCGFFNEAIEYLKRCLTISEEIQALHPLYTAHGCLGYVYLQLENLEASTFHLDACLSLTEQYSQLSTYVPMYRGYRAELEMRMGDWDSALVQAELALQKAIADQQGVAIGQTQLSLAKVLLAGPTANWSKAKKLLKESIALYKKGNAKPFVAIGIMELGKLYLAEQAVKQAHTQFEIAENMFVELAMDWHHGRLLQLKKKL
jgi:tetratricopeptide (TPR) repeat protein